jgi:hypothetical protein
MSDVPHEKYKEVKTQVKVLRKFLKEENDKVKHLEEQLGE